MVAFRLLVIFGILCGISWFLYKILTYKPKTGYQEDVQTLIAQLEVKIRLLKIKAEQGIEGAQAELEKNKLDLEIIKNVEKKLEK